MQRTLGMRRVSSARNHVGLIYADIRRVNGPAPSPLALLLNLPCRSRVRRYLPCPVPLLNSQVNLSRHLPLLPINVVIGGKAGHSPLVAPRPTRLFRDVRGRSRMPLNADVGLGIKSVETAKSGLMHCNKKKGPPRRSSASPICAFEVVCLWPLTCGEAIKQTSASGFRQTRLIAANRRMS